MKDNLLDELRWCYADGNSGPRTKVALKAAIRELERAKPAGEAEQIGPTKAYCRTCKEVTPCEWRWNSDTCADLCCNVCHDIHVCVHVFSDCDSQRLEKE